MPFLRRNLRTSMITGSLNYEPSSTKSEGLNLNSSYVGQIAMALVFCSSSFVLSGWSSQNLTLVQIHPFLGPVQIISAINLCLLPLSWFIGIKAKNQPLAQKVVILCLALSLLQIITTFLKGPLGFDESWYEVRSIYSEAYLERSILLMGLLFTVLSLAQLLCRQTRFSGGIIVGGSLFALVAWLSLLSIFTHFGPPSVFQWTNLSLLSLPTAIAILTVSTIFFIDARHLVFEQKLQKGAWANAMTYCGTFSICLLVWTIASSVESAQLHVNLKRFAQVSSSIAAQTVINGVASLTSVERLFASSESVEKDEFTNFTTQFINSKSALLAIEWAPKVLAENRLAFEDALMELGGSKIQRFNIDGSLSAHLGAKLHYPILFSEPKSDSNKRLGIDHYSDPRRAAIMDKAARTSKPQSLGLINLIGIGDGNWDSDGVLVVLPVHKRRMSQIESNSSANTLAKSDNIQGFLFGLFELSSIADSAYKDFPHGKPSLEIYRDGDLEERAPVFTYDPENAQGLRHWYHPATKINETLSIAGSRYRFQYSLTPEFIKTRSSGFPQIIFLVSLCLAIFATRNMIEGRRRRALSRENEERFRSSFKYAAHGIALVSLEGRWLKVNSSLCALTGYPENELLLKTFQEITHPEDLEKDLALCQELLNGQRETYQMEKRYFRKNGSTVWVLLSGSLVRSEDKTPQYFIAHIQDINERKQAQADIAASMQALSESEEKFRLTINAVREYSIFTLDVAGVITSWNSGGQCLKDYSNDEVIGKHFSFFHPQEERLTEQSVLELASAKTNGKYEVEGWRVQKDGTRFWANVVITPILDEQKRLRGFCKVIRDITERRKFEQALEQARISAELATKAKGEFLANMSHEIRTPLCGIVGFSEELLESDISAEDRKELTHSVLMNSQHLLEIVNDILDFSKIEAGKLVLHHELCELSELLGFIEKSFKPIALSKGLAFGMDLKYPLPRYTRIDPLRVRQILLNLVGNAMKFTEQGGIKLVVTMHETLAGLNFSVVDTGIGLSEEQRAGLFQGFSQADSSTTKRFGGTGLGLVISQRLANSMGGEIKVESSLHSGSKFTFSLPIEKPQRENLMLSAEHSTIEQPPKIGINRQLHGVVLLAEDGIDNQRLMRRLLEKRGLSVEIASNGQQAIRMALNQNFDLIFMDMRMPILDGYAATRELRSRNYKVPIIAFTADASEVNVEQLSSIGCSEVLFKPFSSSQLQSILEKYLCIPFGQSEELISQAERKEFRAGFLQNLSIHIKDLKKSVANEEFIEVAHRLSAAAMFGLPELAELARNLTSVCESGDFEARKKVLERIYNQADLDKATLQ